MRRPGRYWSGGITGLWGAAIQLVDATVNRILDGLATCITRPNLGRVGEGVVIQRGAVIRYPGRIELGDNVRVGRHVDLVSELPDGRLVVGAGTWIGRRCRLDFTGDLVIGEGATLSENVSILTHDHGLNPRSKSKRKALIVGKRVWIGANVTILPHVSHIGDDSIIGAGSVLTKSVPPRVIVAGSAGRVLRTLQEQETDREKPTS